MRLAVLWLCLCTVLQGARGVADPQLSSFDDLMNGLLAKWRIPGAAIGVAHDGRLVLARGYGLEEAETGRPVQPDSLFRVTGISPVASGAAAESLASVADLLRLATAQDGSRPGLFLKAAAGIDWRNFRGAPGSSAYLLQQAASGAQVALLFNTRPSEGGAFDAEVASAVGRIAQSIPKWPSTDLFVDGPELFARDVVNAADSSGGRVAPGEIVTLYPSNVGPAELAGTQVNGDGRVATVTGETRVLFDGIAAPMASSVRGRVGAVVPYGVARRKTTQVVVEYQGVRSAPVTLAVAESAPALFTLDGTGKGQAAMLNDTGCCNSARNPAARGSIAALYATGAGQTNPPGIDGDLSGYLRIAEMPGPQLPLRVTVGGVPAEIVYAGAAPHAVAGLLQLNFRIPADAPAGDAVPLALAVGNARSPDGVTMAVRTRVERILVVDSQVAIRSQLTQILKGAGYEVDAARDGMEAAAQSRRHPFDLLICSLAMPEAERVELIRGLEAVGRLPKIVATGGALDAETLRAADLLGAQAVLTKPFVADRVLRRVRELLRPHIVPYVTGGDVGPR